MELNELKKLVSFNKKIVVILLLIIGIVMISSYSYALYQVNFIKSNVVVLRTASNLNITTTIDDTNSDTFTLPASGNKTVVVHLDTDGITSAMAYKMYYVLTGTGSFTITSEETFTDNKIEGVLQPIDKTGYDYKITGKNITLTFTNNSENALTVKLGAIGGFEKSGASLTNQQQLFVGLNETEDPILSLDKETYITENLSTWTLTSGAAVSNGELTLSSTSSTATSGYINVNGGFWYPIFDGYTTSAASNYTPKGGIGWYSFYYDNNKNSTTSIDGYPNNFWAYGNLNLNEWYNVDWMARGGYNKNNMKQRYGPNVKYITIKSYVNGSYSQPTVKIKNFKIYGEAIPNSFYLINVTSSDNVGVVTTKYDKGNQNKEYFQSDGYDVRDNQIRVTENGTYTVYVADAVGNATIETINITDIV